MELHKSSPTTHSPPLMPGGRIGTNTTTEEVVEELAAEIKDWQITHGSLLKLVRSETLSTVHARSVGVSIFPTPLRRQDFEEAKTLQPVFNELYIRAASDFEWLAGVVSPLIKHDHLCHALWDVLLETRRVGSVQDLVCGIFRSDYMSQRSGIKQVEMNTFSIAGACHAQRVAGMHLHLERKGFPRFDEHTDRTSEIPRSNSIASIVGLLSQAHQLYEASSSYPPCVLMIVQPFNFNITDERPIEYGLCDLDIPCYRYEWQALADRGDLTLAPDRALLFQNGSRIYEVSVIYFRAGYEAAEYGPVGKQMRVKLEVSRAIKCPDIATHLTTLKVVQEALTRSGAVEQFLPSKVCSQLRHTFMPMQALDSSSEGLIARRYALDPALAKDYVLKPNLEGGGHNIYRSDIPDFLAEVPEGEWQKYILMRCIEPIEQDGHLMLADELFRGPVVGELGAIGTSLWRSEGNSVTILLNQLAGWTFKVKPAVVDEMSVVKGYGCFSTPLLVDGEDDMVGSEG